MLTLTSYERMRRYLSDEQDDLLTDSEAFRRVILGWIYSLSKEIEIYLNRTLDSGTQTEYFNLRDGRRKFWISAPPITAITSVYEDELGLWEGSESEITDCTYTPDGKAVVLPYRLFYDAPRGLRIIYTGGLASSGVQSVYAVSDGSGFSAGNYIKGSTSDAMGIIRSASAASLTVEILRGRFEADETIAEYSDEGDTATGDSTTISSITSRALAESYEDIVRATEMEIRYRWKHKSDFELVGNTRDGVNLRRRGDTSQLQFTPEVLNILKYYRLPFFV